MHSLLSIRLRQCRWIQSRCLLNYSGWNVSLQGSMSFSVGFRISKSAFSTNIFISPFVQSYVFNAFGIQITYDVKMWLHFPMQFGSYYQNCVVVCHLDCALAIRGQMSYFAVNANRFFNSLRPSDAYMSPQSNHHCSDNGLSPGRRQAITWTNDEQLLIGPLGTNFSEILIEILTFSYKKMRLKLSSGKYRLSCLGLNLTKGSWRQQSQT